MSIVLVDPKEVSEAGCFTSLPVYRSAHDEAFEEALASRVKHYSHLVSPRYPDTILEIRDMCDFIRYLFPGVLPDVVEDAIWLTSLAFFYDRIQDEKTIVLEGDAESQPQVSEMFILEEISQCLLSWSEKYRHRGGPSIRAVASWMKTAAKRKVDEIPEFKTVEEYMTYREEDVGFRPTPRLIALFAQLPELSPAEEVSIERFMNLAMSVASLWNDYTSWEREFVMEEKPFSAMTVIMSARGKSAAEAKEELATVILQYEARLKVKLEELREDASISDAAKTHAEHGLYLASGAAFWHVFSQRYKMDKGDVVKENGVKENGVKENGFHEETALAVSGHGTQQAVPDGPSDAIHPYMLEVASVGKMMPTMSVSPPNDTLVLAPYEHIKSVPGKGNRTRLIHALNRWIGADPESVQAIDQMIYLLHHSSLLIDDIEDGSTLRRGQPAAHSVFGIGQTINTANYLFLLASAEAFKLRNEASKMVYIEEVQALHIGQSMDLFWRDTLQYPTQDQYLDMVDKKTGGLFRLATRLLYLHGDGQKLTDYTALENLNILLGRYYQIRDDYKNLTAEEYTSQKGFCEDLDEGKISFPIVHCLNHPQTGLKLSSILAQRSRAGTISLELKHEVLRLMKIAGSLDYSRRFFEGLGAEILAEIPRIEKQAGVQNATLQMLIMMLMSS